MNVKYKVTVLEHQLVLEKSANILRNIYKNQPL